ncbi:His-Xaa-Ser system protein HxsD [Vibrio tritonius]|uniref:His-Xaa-Ser system protein HxsD n=1 Tax=Vibrio tritonius TaxID=1435069 RepID=A0ABS7YKJ8_9VIBR|nr:His-Xaa-Ser system protein HxsD [Vibrio tritonius]MCA2015517.1 His-Xaa-Ser system protein HxsD [Vibrio tritonius]
MCSEEVRFDSRIFSKEAVLKACYDFDSLATYDVSMIDGQIIVKFSPKLADIAINDICDQLKTSVIDYQLREKIFEQTNSLKEALIKAALNEAGIR